jgi:hypothetical protein
VGFSTEQNSVVLDFLNSASYFEILLVTAVIAPLSEEASFRLMITKNKYTFASGAFLMLLFVYSRIQLNGVFIILSIITLPLIWIAILSPTKLVERLIHDNLLALILFSTSVFALSHLVNFRGFETFWYLIPILVMTQFYSGTVYAFMKLRFGFEYAILSHALFNALIVTYIEIFGPFYLFG